MDFVGILQDYGFPMLAAVAMAYFIYFIYTFITTEIKVKLGEANTVLIALIDLSLIHISEPTRPY